MGTIPIKKISPTFSIPSFGIGTWRMGGVTTRDTAHDDQADIRSIKEAIEMGVRHIDTAEMYAAGHAESILGEAIKGYDRSSLFLASKVMATHLSAHDLRSSLEASLLRMGISYLDLYFIHFPSDTIPLQETMTALQQCVEKGLINHIGVSNFSLSRLKEAQSYCSYPICAIQAHYNLIYREPERTGLLAYCQKNDIALIAWRPVEKGLLTASGIPAVDMLCKKYQKTPAQIAINWLASQKDVVTIAKSTSLDHLKENIAAVRWDMEKEDIELLRVTFPNQQDVSNAVPLK